MSGIYPAPWRILDGLVDKNGESLAIIEDANGDSPPFGLVKRDIALRIVEAINRAANEEPLSAKRERFWMEKSGFLLRMKADKLEDYLRKTAATLGRCAGYGTPEFAIAEEAAEFCESIAPSDYADCIDYAMHVLAKHEESRREKFCGVDLAVGTAAARQDRDAEPLTEPWWPEGAKT